MGRTLVIPWNCPCKAIVLPQISIKWGLHWSTHETAHINHCLATHWYYMGFTLVGPWNCTWKTTVFSTNWYCMGFTLVDSWNCLYKPLSYHTLVLHGVYSGWSMKLHMKIKATVFPHIGISWGLHWSTHETAYINHCLTTHWYCLGLTLVGPWNCTWKATVLFHTLALHGVYIGRLMKVPIYRHCLATHWNYRVPCWSAHEVAHVKPMFCHSLVLFGAPIGWPMKLPMFSNCFAKHWHYMGFTLLAHETAHV